MSFYEQSIEKNRERVDTRWAHATVACGQKARQNTAQFTRCKLTHKLYTLKATIVTGVFYAGARVSRINTCKQKVITSGMTNVVDQSCTTDSPSLAIKRVSYENAKTLLTRPCPVVAVNTGTKTSPWQI